MYDFVSVSQLRTCKDLLANSAEVWILLVNKSQNLDCKNAVTAKSRKKIGHKFFGANIMKQMMQRKAMYSLPST